MTATHPHPSSHRPDDRFTDGWWAATWAAVVLGLFELGVAAYVALVTRDYIRDTRHDVDPLSGLGYVIAGAIAVPAAFALGLVGLAFLRRWNSSARKTLVCFGGGLLALEAVPVANLLLAAV